LVEGDFEPVRDALRRALTCAPGEDPADYAWTDEEIGCVFDPELTGCELDGRNCVDCGPEDLFPSANTYLELPLVLRAADYLEADESLDVDRLVRDFGCMAMVGTRGYGIERGLDAAVLAVSPELTGGALGRASVDPEAPNHGFVRKDADFGVIFVTDENDCSHDGTLDIGNACGAAECAYASLDPEGPLTDPLAMAQALKEGLSQTKGAAVGDDELVAASIHGRSQKFEGPVLTSDACEGKTENELVPPSCSSLLGNASSGDRYETFLSGFERSFPRRDQNGDRYGWMCA
jgi:hypothetical protein